MKKLLVSLMLSASMACGVSEAEFSVGEGAAQESAIRTGGGGGACRATTKSECISDLSCGWYCPQDWDKTEGGHCWCTKVNAVSPSDDQGLEKN